MLPNNTDERSKIDLDIIKNNSQKDRIMIEQTAKVVSTKQGYAWVVPVNKAGCTSCQSKKSCANLNFTGLFPTAKPKTEQWYVHNPLHAKPGDEVVIGMQGNTLVVYSALAYLLPLITMLVFAVLGGQIFTWLQFSQEVGATLAGIAGLFSGLKMAAWLGVQMAKSIETAPVILRHSESTVYTLTDVRHA